MNGIIYKWDNLVTNKSYIGKTLSKENRYNLFLEFDKHYSGPHIDKARKKYNDIKYWKYSILFSMSSNNRKYLNDILNEKEIEYISLYNTNDKNIGYNISSGGTFGDTYYSLTEEERNDRINKFHYGQISKGYKWMYKDDIAKKVDKEQQESYLNDGWKFGRKEKVVHTKIKKKKILTEQHKHNLSISQKNVSPEILEKRKIMGRHNRIKYNKSEKHRLEAINSNKNRWKDGCPETTKNKMSNSHKGLAKGLIWISNNEISKMIKPSELKKYIDDGWHKGRK